MRDPKRISELIELIKEIWEKDPDLRFQQLIYNLQRGYSQQNNDIGKVESNEEDGFTKIGYDLFNTEDDKFIEYLHKKIDNEL